MLFTDVSGYRKAGLVHQGQLRAKRGEEPKDSLHNHAGLKKEARLDHLKALPTDVRAMFLDSGAHALYTKYVRSQGSGKVQDPHVRARLYAFYRTKEFKRYCNVYAKFVKENQAGIDFYVTVDAIYNPELSWETLLYLEDELGLKPVPVIHSMTDTKWITKHLERGYKFIGLGGLGQETTRTEYLGWADRVFGMLCPGPDNMPLVKVHGFAMTSWDLMRRYPWWSVDSTSWIKLAAYGTIYVPHRRKGEWTFEESPYAIDTSLQEIARGGSHGKHIALYSAMENQTVVEWLDEIKVPIGCIDDKGDPVTWGVLSSWSARAKANLLYFERFRESLPEWPWAFRTRVFKGFGLE